jgi:hypothetical protein
MIGGSEEVTLLLKLITDVSLGKQRLGDLNAAALVAAQREEAASAAEAALAQRTADLDRREAAVKEMEFAAHTEKLRVEGIRIHLVEFSRQLRDTEDQIKLRMLRHAGLLDGFNPNIQSVPGWAAVDAALFAKPADAHFDDDSVNVVTEPLAGAVTGSTITRSRRPRRGTQSDAQA